MLLCSQVRGRLLWGPQRPGEGGWGPDSAPHPSAPARLRLLRPEAEAAPTGDSGARLLGPWAEKTPVEPEYPDFIRPAGLCWLLSQAAGREMGGAEEWPAAETPSLWPRWAVPPAGVGTPAHSTSAKGIPAVALPSGCCSGLRTRPAVPGTVGQRLKERGDEHGDIGNASTRQHPRH